MSANGPAHTNASMLAQLLGETIVHHAPHTAEINETKKWEHLEAWLEGLEQHAAGQVGPFLQKVLDASDPPPEIRQLLDEAISPPAQFSAVIEQIFVFGIVSQLLSVSVTPFIQGVSNDLWAAAVSDGISVPISPAVIATAVARGLNKGDPPTTAVPQWAYDEAAKSGVAKDDVDLQASIVGTPPAPQELFELLRRKVIDIDGVKKGLKEGDTRDDWVDQLTQLAHAWLTPLDFVRAAVQSQMPYAEAEQWAEATGLDVSTELPLNTGDTEASPNMFGLAFSIAGRPPGPQELARMTLRGIIPKDGTGAGTVSFQQGIAESDVKTKWTPALWKLAQYVPPPREVGTLLERGAIDHDQAVAYWQMTGVPAELAQGYAYMAEQQHVGQDKLLAKGQVLTGYFEGLFSKADAEQLLGLLGYRGQVADDLLALTAFRRNIQAINYVVNKVKTLYTGYKISATNAQKALDAVGVPDDQVSELLGIWEAIRIAPVRLPTEAQIGKAVKYGTLSNDEALAELAALGLQPRDAAIVLSAESEQPIKPLPPAGTTVTG